MFNLFRKKSINVNEPTVTPGQSNANQFLIITAATNFGLVVMPQTKEPLMFVMEPTDTVASCVNRNAPYVSAAVDVASCLVVELSAELPNHTRVANKIFALILPDPGILINQDLVLVGYEEIDRIPGPTSSMLKMLVKQVPQEYFAETMVESAHTNSSSQPLVPSSPVAPSASAGTTVEQAGFDGAQVEQNTVQTGSSVAVATPEPTGQLEPKDAVSVVQPPETPSQTA